MNSKQKAGAVTNVVLDVSDTVLEMLEEAVKQPKLAAAVLAVSLGRVCAQARLSPEQFTRIMQDTYAAYL